MKILKRIGMALGVLLLLLIIVGFFLPSTYSAERSITVNAPVEVVFNQVNDLKNWETWGPWAAEDPNMTVTYGDITEGVGASHSWTSEKHGPGKLTIAKSEAHKMIRTDLDFYDKGQAKGRFDFEPTDDGVKVTWGMDGDAGYNLIMRYFGVMMDSMVGPYFEKGLTGIKEIAEAEAAQMKEEMMTTK